MTTKPDDFKQITLTLKAEPAGEDRFGRAPNYRLKLLLKNMLRSFGFRCVRMSQDTGRINTGESETPQ